MRGDVLWRLMVLCLMVLACNQAEEEAEPQAVAEATIPAPPMVLNYNFGPDPLQLDPTYLNDPASESVVAQLFEGLTTFDPVTAQPLPALATEWDVSGDGLIVTFRMREDARWVNQSGELVGEVTAEDVVFAIKRACHPDTVAPLKSMLFILKGCQEVNQTEGIPDIDSVGVRAIERFTVEFTLDRPAAYLPAILGMPVAWPLPAQVITQAGEAWAEPENLVTNGPYLLRSLTEDSLLLERNPLYHEAASVGIERVNGRRIDEEAAFALYQAGELDTMLAPAAHLATVQQDSALAGQLTQAPGGCTVGYGFTLVKSPVDNARVRRALSYAVDRRWLVENILGASEIAATHFAPPGVFGTPPVDEGGVSGDVALAQQLMMEAGYPGGAGLAPITLAYPDEPVQAAVANAVAEMWRSSFQIEVSVVSYPGDRFRQIIRSITPVEEMPHLWLLVWCGSYPDEHDWIYEVFYVGGARGAGAMRQYDPSVTIRAGDNVVRRAPGDFDELVAQAAEVSDPMQRQLLYAEAEQLLVRDEAAFIPLYSHAVNFLSQPWLERTFFTAVAPSFKEWTVNMAERQPPTPTATAVPSP